MCSAMAPAPARRHTAQGKAPGDSTASHSRPRIPEHPPPSPREEGTALRPPWEPRCRPPAAGGQSSARRAPRRPRAPPRRRPGEPRSARAGTHRSGAPAGSGSAHQQRRTGSARLGSPSAGRRAPGTYRDGAGGGFPGRPPAAHWSAARCCPAPDGAGGRHNGPAASPAGGLAPGTARLLVGLSEPCSQHAPLSRHGPA